MSEIESRDLLIRDVPIDVHDKLKERAAAEGQSVQAYMFATVVRIARRPTLREFFEAIEARPGGSTATRADIAAALAEHRER